MPRAETATRPSPALWVPLVWYAIATSQSITRWLSLNNPVILEDTSYLEGAPIDRNVYLCLITLGLAILVRRRIDWGRLFRNNTFLVALLAFMAISLLWSDFPGVSSKRWVKTAGSVIMALIVLTETNLAAALSALLRRVFFIHLPLSLIFIKYFRKIGVAWDYLGGGYWVGVTTHKNILGEVLMSSGLYFTWDTIRQAAPRMRHLANYAFLALTAFLLLAAPSRSSTSIILLAFGLLFLTFLFILRDRVDAIGRYLGYLIAFLFVFYLAVTLALGAFTQQSAFAFLAQSSGRDVTLTGRTDLWVDLIGLGMKSPLLGVGYGSFWIGDVSNDIWTRHIWKPNQGHNGYIDIFLEIGIAGLFLFAGVLVQGFWHLLRKMREDFFTAQIRTVFFVVILLHNLTESSFLRGANDLWLLFLISCVNVDGVRPGPAPLPAATPPPERTRARP